MQNICIGLSNKDYYMKIGIYLSHKGEIELDGDCGEGGLCVIHDKIEQYIIDTLKEITLDGFVSIFRVLIRAIEKIDMYLKNFEITKPSKRAI